MLNAECRFYIVFLESVYYLAPCSPFFSISKNPVALYPYPHNRGSRRPYPRQMYN